MRALVQRVSCAAVRVEGRTVGQIGRGFLVLLGVHESDDTGAADFLAGKVERLRIFEDAAGKMNLPLAEVGGAVLAVSQFTLYSDTRKGNRPSFIEAARPERAQPLYARFCEVLRGAGIRVETGVFGAQMEVELVNDGPVTVLLESYC